MRLSFTLLFSFLISVLSAQLNMELYSEVDYTDNPGNDVWGYTAPDGSEYALMGTFQGVSIVNITDPRNPVEVDFIDQQRSTWRDIKTWGEYAYVTADEPGTTDGILIIDLSTLPDSISYVNNNLDVPNEGIINTCHNLYIDEFGYVYLSGCGNLNNGGLLIYDVASTPGEPIFAGLGRAVYSHDVYVRNNLAYSSDINAGVFSVMDVTEKSDVRTLATQETPFNFTHNAWLSDDGLTLFTTDEVANAPVAAYDVSDLNNIRLLDEYRPQETLGDGVPPHNVHVWNDWLIISYYTDGCKVVDAAQPDNLIEVGNFDTFFGGFVGFAGAWGAYPFFPSGTVIVGDMGEGFFGNDSGKLVVLGPTYVRAAYLEGRVTDAQTTDRINNVKITLDAIGIQDFTDALGVYKTGYHEAGMYEMTVSAFGYKTQTRTVSLENGQVTTANFELVPAERVNFNVEIIDGATQQGIRDAQFSLSVDEFVFDFITDENGVAELSNTVVSQYDFIAGAWGYQYNCSEDLDIITSLDNSVLTIELNQGYEDVFDLDLGWTVVDNTFQGPWERGLPIGVPTPFSDQILLAPRDDSSDKGNGAFVTGNTGSLMGGVLIGGQTTLTSPVFDIENMNNPTISYDTWFWSLTQQGLPGQSQFVISVDNGMESVDVDTITAFDLNSVFQGIETAEWRSSEEIMLKDHIEVTSTMTVTARVEAIGNNTAVEAGFDNFKVQEGTIISTNEAIFGDLDVYPNPSSNEFEVIIPEGYRQTKIELEIFNIKGERVFLQDYNQISNIRFGNNLSAGVYTARLKSNKDLLANVKFVKM